MSHPSPALSDRPSPLLACRAPRNHRGRTGRRAHLDRGSPFKPGQHGLFLSAEDRACVPTGRVWEVEGGGPEAVAAALAKRESGCVVVHCKDCHYVTEYRPVEPHHAAP